LVITGDNVQTAAASTIDQLQISKVADGHDHLPTPRRGALVRTGA
jgi:hypothetical protein